MGAIQKHNYYYWKYKYEECYRELVRLKREMTDLSKLNRMLVKKMRMKQLHNLKDVVSEFVQRDVSEG